MNLQPYLPTLLILAVELLVLLLAAAAFFGWRTWKRRRGERAAADALVETVSREEPSRREALVRLFSEGYGLEGEELEAAVEEFLDREKAFYRLLIGVYLGREPGRLKELPQALDSMIRPALELMPAGMVEASELEEMGRNLEQLQQEKGEMSRELEQSRQEMEELLREYQAAFNRRKEEAARQAEQEAGAEAEVEEENPVEQPAAPAETGELLDALEEEEEAAEVAQPPREEVPADAVTAPEAHAGTEVSEEAEEAAEAAESEEPSTAPAGPPPEEELPEAGEAAEPAGKEVQPEDGAAAEPSGVTEEGDVVAVETTAAQRVVAGTEEPEASPGPSATEQTVAPAAQSPAEGGAQAFEEGPA
ncbi:MAG: hypothetical protein D6786_08465, partial [Gammaproteobacteria bacterium]